MSLHNVSEICIRIYFRYKDNHNICKFNKIVFTTVITFLSLAMREDRYFFAGRAIAVSLIHGGPPACFVSPTLFSCLVHGPDRGQPVLEDIVDVELRDKIKRVMIFCNGYTKDYITI